MSETDILKPQKKYSYEKANDVEDLVRHMIDINMYPKVQMDKMVFIRSKKKEKEGKKKKTYSDDAVGKMEEEIDKAKGKRNFIARVVTLNKFWMEIYKEKTCHFCIEVASENYDALSDKDKKRVIVHELYHIPEDFDMGKMRKHDEFSNIHVLYGRYNTLIKDKEKEI